VFFIEILWVKNTKNYRPFKSLEGVCVTSIGYYIRRGGIKILGCRTKKNLFADRYLLVITSAAAPRQ